MNISADFNRNIGEDRKNYVTDDLIKKNNLDMDVGGKINRSNIEIDEKNKSDHHLTELEKINKIQNDETSHNSQYNNISITYNNNSTQKTSNPPYSSTFGKEILKDFKYESVTFDNLNENLNKDLNLMIDNVDLVNPLVEDAADINGFPIKPYASDVDI